MRTFIEQFGLLPALLPLLGAALIGLLGRPVQRRFGEKPIAVLACGTVLLSFLFALGVFGFFVSTPEGEVPVIAKLYTWLEAGQLRADIAFLFDPLSSVMILIVTGVGFLIHLYSAAYMKGDGGFYRYFAYLNLFIFSMLVLVLAENLLLMFIGWEGVGLCSYLLISFWYGERENAVAGNKAFIVNRVGDLGFLLGILLLFWLLSAATVPQASSAASSLLSFPFIAENAHLLSGSELWGVSAVTIICFCLFLGATGKSAQLPLHVWLPDAMAGPTPVSALIHAATMVTAGIYMIGRLHVLFSLSAAALDVIAAVGAATALFAATIACTQHDIKKVLAYSTVSQLGYMVLAMGVTAFSAGAFHLMTHAFFKACLFLGAGSVIMGMHHEQDIRQMGGLKKFMPRTFAAFLVAALAIAGVPPLSGFFSKDEILWRVWSSGHPVLWLMGLAAAGLTAFYMTRLVVLAFYGEHRGHHDQPQIRESPSLITTPVLLLALLSALAGSLGIPAALGGSNRFERFLAPVFGPVAEALHDPLEYLLMAASIATALGGIALGVLMYRVRPDLPDRLAQRLRAVHGIVQKKYFIDEIYHALFVKGAQVLARISAALDRYGIDLLVNLSGYVLRLKAFIAGRFDQVIVDGAVNGIGDSTLAAGAGLRRFQTGRVQASILLFFGLLAVGILLMLF